MEELNAALQELRETLQTASHLVLSFGTAWVYRLQATQQIVANCHKVPQKHFSKELLSTTDIAEVLRLLFGSIRKTNPKIEIIATVSPVRHLKDGFVENTRSKSHLIAGLHRAIDDSKQVAYFPSYELMMDELRGYRFYKPDMIHPNSVAVAYIWERFAKVWIHPKTVPLQKEVDTIQKGLAHRPFHPESSSHQKFKADLLEKIDQLKLQWPHMRF